ncbi:MAG: APC family permease [Acidobacteria bacterium]|nr:APC family permease [Acidobacteriota bacterium]
MCHTPAGRADPVSLQTQPSTPPRLKRALTLWDLVFCGIIMIQPTAPMPPYGVISQEARGHVVTTILIAMVAMLFTAISYGRMARAYPAAGSAFTYVGREIHPGAGYITGWSMAMDYMLNPIICIIWCSKAAINVMPGVSYAIWVCFFAALFTSLNLRGIRASARTNEALAVGMGIVILIFLGTVIRYLLETPGIGGKSFVRPFYDPENFSLPHLFTGTSIAVLTYIGFDGVSTLSEEVEDPRRNVLLATVLTCVVTGVLASLEVYAAQLVWPDYATYPDVDTAYVHVAGRVGGAWLFQVVNLTLLVATVGSGSAAQLAAARLLYGMGRDNAIPRSFFAVVDPKRGIPRNSVIFIGAVALAGSFFLSYQLGAELLNFGAFIAFMGVNAAAFVRYWVRAEKKKPGNLFPPVLGFVICLYIWSSLRTPAKLVGAAWVAIGVIYGAAKTQGFRSKLISFEPPPD